MKDEYNSLLTRIDDDKADEKDILSFIEYVDSGMLRVAEKVDGKWITNQRVKKGILKYFAMCEVSKEVIQNFTFRDKIPLKKNFKNVRIVPGGNSVRYGSYLADQVVMMPPSYVNIGAYVDEGTMIDSNVLVGSCAQIGKYVHLSAGVQIGGVLEPINAHPVIIEDEAFIGAGSLVVEGVIVESGAVIAPGVVLSASTKILEIDNDGNVIKEHRGIVPENAIVIPGARPKGEVMIQSPIIIGYKTEETAKKVSLTDMLRQF